MTKQIKFPKTVLMILAMVGLTVLLTAGLGASVSAAPANAPATVLQAEMHDETGVLILSVVPDSPADRAGIARGDIVLAVDENDIDGVETFAGAIGALVVGDEIVITVLHGDDTLELPVILGERNGRTYLGVVPYAEEAVSEDEADAEGVDADETAEEAVEDEASDEDASDEDANADSANAAEGEDADEAEEAEEDAAPAKRRSPRSMMPFGQGGAMIAEVVEDGPADEAGLVAGDLIVAVDGQALSEDVDFAALIGSYAPGDVVTLTVTNIESNESLEVPVTLAAHPEDDERAFLGIAYVLAPAFPDMGDLAPNEDADEDEDEPTGRNSLRSMMPFAQGGATVAEVVEDSPAYQAGLVVGDLIVAVDGQELSEEIDFAELIGSYAPGDVVTLTVTNVEANETMDVPVLLGAHPDDEERAYLGIAYMPVPNVVGMEDVAPDEDADNEDEDGEDADLDKDEAVEETDEADEDAAPRGRHGRFVMPAGLGGAKVAEVVEDSPAYQAGLVVGDLIVAVDGEELGPGATLGDLIGAYGPGDEVELTIQSDGSDETVEVTVVLGAHPDDAEHAYLGVAYMPVLNRDWDQRNRRFHTQPMPRQRAEPESKDNNGCFHDHDGMHDGMHEEFHGSEGFEHHKDCEGDRESGEHHGSDEHSGMMMPFFHHGMGGHGLEDFDFDQLSEEHLEALQEMFPDLFPDAEE